MRDSKRKKHMKNPKKSLNARQRTTLIIQGAREKKQEISQVKARVTPWTKS